VRKWRRRQSQLRTALRRPELLARACLTEEDRRWLHVELAGRSLDKNLYQRMLTAHLVV
jgi:tRNA G37 N-methylase TrmD